MSPWLMLGCDGRTLRSPLQVRLRRLACRFEVRASDRLIFLTFQQCECLKNVGFFNLLLAQWKKGAVSVVKRPLFVREAEGEEPEGWLVKL